MRIDKVSSERIELLRFPLIIGVVFIHAFAYTRGEGALANVNYSLFETISLFIRTMLSQGLARTAVPLFFIISGYFFFLGFDYSFIKYKDKLQKRIHTLLIPYLFWNGIVLLLKLLETAVLKQSSPITDGMPLYSVDGIINAFVGIKGNPIAYQFWFIRDLIVMVVISPVLYFLIKKIPLISLIGFFILWYLNIWPFHIPDILAAFYFFLGGFIGYKGLSLFMFDDYGKVILPSYIIVLFVDTATKTYSFNGYIHRFGIVLGLIAVLYITKYLLNIKKVKSFLLWSAAFSFFVFAAHEPLLGILFGKIYSLFNKTETLVFLLYFLLPVFVISITITAYIILRKTVPKFLGLITGGRV